MRSIVLLLVAVPLVAQDLSQDQIASVARAVEAQRKAQQIPAVSVAVARGGRVVHAAAFGEADLENGVAATAASLFRTASIAKPLTATAVMQLAEQGKLAALKSTAFWSNVESVKDLREVGERLSKSVSSAIT